MELNFSCHLILLLREKKRIEFCGDGNQEMEKLLFIPAMYYFYACLLQMYVIIHQILEP